MTMTATDKVDLRVDELADLDARFERGDFLTAVAVGVGIGGMLTLGAEKYE